ncbi:hypothetical protein EJ06DRAFT_311587 [Trichodelitschia bisporula]|uniref:Secreted protein n=1 Tax=Trichodelitschia bisporula TaxID=703511 RepID=A0A6G1I3V1_9PEZI|nr:hypothetical protein EJ06DRAFT_311587 [Trichodelitschia bisporula]
MTLGSSMLLPTIPMLLSCLHQSHPESGHTTTDGIWDNGRYVSMVDFGEGDREQWLNARTCRLARRRPPISNHHHRTTSLRGVSLPIKLSLPAQRT